MAHPNQSIAEKLLDLQNGLSIWKVHIDAIREQEVNARVMDNYKFDLLSETIKGDARLESLPLTFRSPEAEEGDYFHLISGHHRTRAARSAGLQEIYILNIDEELDTDMVRAKQLAHNSLQGHDDPEKLAEIYYGIDDVNARTLSGLTDMELQKIETPNVPADDIEFHFGYEDVHILFLDSEFKEWQEVTDILKSGAHIEIADKADFDEFVEQVHNVVADANVRNISSIMKRMLAIVRMYYEEHPIEDDGGKE